MRQLLWCKMSSTEIKRSTKALSGIEVLKQMNISFRNLHERLFASKVFVCEFLKKVVPTIAWACRSLSEETKSQITIKISHAYLVTKLTESHATKTYLKSVLGRYHSTHVMTLKVLLHWMQSNAKQKLAASASNRFT